jgi:hypothetical protein
VGQDGFDVPGLPPKTDEGDQAIAIPRDVKTVLSPTRSELARVAFTSAPDFQFAPRTTRRQWVSEATASGCFWQNSRIAFSLIILTFS